MAAASRIDCSEEAGVRIVRFRDRQLFDEPTVREVTDQILAQLPKAGEQSSGTFRLVLDLSGVELMSSSMLGKLILIQRRVQALQGTLCLCELSSNIQATLRSTNLDRLFKVTRDRREALEALT
jgi:anti-sigma B factor antagonist